MVFATNKKMISEQEFDFLKVYLKAIDEERINIAKDVLVYGLKPSEVAEKYGISRQRVSLNTARVWEAYEFDREVAEKRNLVTAAIHLSIEKPNNNMIIPAGWEQVTLLAPSSLVNKFRLEVQSQVLGSLDLSPEETP